MGEHRVSILKEGHHIPNSPLTILVVQSEIGEAGRVKAHGEGLVSGRTFTNASFMVDTREAGTHTVPVIWTVVLVIWTVVLVIWTVVLVIWTVVLKYW